MSEIQYQTGGFAVRTKGLRSTLKALEKTGADAEDMKDLMHSIGEVVISAARPRTPQLTGKLRGSMRAGRGKTKAVVRTGGKRVPYAPVLEYGWAGHGIEARHFMQLALQASQRQVVQRLDDGLKQIIAKNNLDVR